MKYVYEAIGTFFLVLVIGMCVIGPNAAPPGFAPLAIGSVLAVMIFAGGHVSGGHYNPAVSLGIAIRGKMTWAEMGIYWVAQLVGAAVAAFIVLYVKGSAAEIAKVDVSIKLLPALLAEFLFTFALVFVVLNVATAKGTSGNSYFGWAIGFTVLAGAYAMGAVSGGAFNPAVALGITVMNISPWANIWVFVIAELLGGAVAAYVFKAAHPGE